MANYLLDFLSDPTERSKIRQGFMDAVNRGAIATTLGAPADMLNLGANALRAGYGYAGHKLGLLSADQMPELVEKLPLGSEWIGDKMQQYGMVSGNRNALAEGFAGSLAVTPQQSARMVAGVALPGLADAGVGKAMFIGPSAKTWDKAAAATAQKLERAGADPRAIWSETGTIRGLDGELRQEISDHGALFNPSTVGGRKIENDLTTGVPGFDFGPAVGSVIEHQLLKGAYPDGLTKSTLIGNKNTMFGDGVQGFYDETAGRLQINAPAKAADARSTMLHELQHAIQQREGFARGGSPESMASVLQDAKAAERRQFGGLPSAYDDAASQLGKVYEAQHLKKLETIGQKASPKPSDITGMSAWYEHSDKLRESLGAMPNKAGSARDSWIRDAANFMRNWEAQKVYGVDWNPLFKLSADDLAKQARTLSRQTDKYKDAARGAAEVDQKFKELSKLSDFDQYRRLAGEAEARATQARMNMTTAERRATFPYDSYDVPVNQLIVRSLLD